MPSAIVCRLSIAVKGRTDGRHQARTNRLDDAVPVCPGKDIPTCLHCFDPFGFITQRDAGYTKPIGFFLHAPGIGEENACGLFKGDDVKIAYGINQRNIVRWLIAVFI